MQYSLYCSRRVTELILCTQETKKYDTNFLEFDLNRGSGAILLSSTPLLIVVLWVNLLQYNYEYS